MYQQKMDLLNSNIFGKKKFSNLLEEIYNNQKAKSEQIYSLIMELQPLIKSPGDASLLVPLIKEYLEVGVKNDDHLIKLAGIAQRALQSSMDSSEEGMFTDKEMEDLNKIIEEQKNKKK